MTREWCQKCCPDRMPPLALSFHFLNELINRIGPERAVAFPPVRRVAFKQMPWDENARKSQKVSGIPLAPTRSRIGSMSAAFVTGEKKLGMFFSFPIFCLRHQGCQIVCFQTKNTNLGKICRAKNFQNVDIYYGHLEYLMDILNILRIF
jgi:hypothetical protein